MDTNGTLIQLGISVALGLLVGLQRERKGDVAAGIRTFALITVLGTLAALLGKAVGEWVVAAGLLAVAAMMLGGLFSKWRDGEQDPGLTTEFAALVMYAIGAGVVLVDMLAAVVLTGAVVVLLHWKEPLHGFVRRMGDQDVTAIMQLVLIAVVILPLLPNRAFGPYGVFNPFEIWLVVVIIVGISLAGYVVYKFLPPTAGTLVAASLGGLISSTATTVSYARRTKEQEGAAAIALQAIMVANTVSAVRVIALVGIFASAVLPGVVVPLAVMAGVLGLLSAVTLWMGRGERARVPEQKNPAELKTAIFFGIMYSLVKLAVAFAKDKLGQSGLYVVGMISGLTDMDAITLSVSDIAKQNQVATGVAWRVIVVALLSNLVFKLGTVAVLGNRALLWKAGVFFLVAIGAGAGLIFGWRG